MKKINSSLPSDFLRLNTAFKLPMNATEKAIALSQEIGRNYKTFFIIDNVQFYPHITIYSPEYPQLNINKILKVVERITSNASQIYFRFRKINSNQGFISIGFDYSPEIKRLHEEIVKKLNPLRMERIRKGYLEDSDYHMEFSQKQKENIKNYGYPDVMDLYKPHLTIARLKNESLAQKVSKDVNWDIPEFSVDKLAIYEMGEHGTCKELIKEFELK
jgi:2'-5' RNA ligase